MRTKKAEIASQNQIVQIEPVAVADEPIPIMDDVPQAKEFVVSIRFANRENAENFKFKLKSLGYDNAEISEV